ncbi:unnamed protein product [Prorocentrum cordatum]|uniref:Uncharacterized protein n=1 Tax=Prorocentrum cordatum TaxID=2364126 RepID=A0ABN9USK0_9DINO|nr:unnamed protein product [Polarella glacialis]
MGYDDGYTAAAVSAQEEPARAWPTRASPIGNDFATQPAAKLLLLLGHLVGGAVGLQSGRRREVACSRSVNLELWLEAETFGQDADDDLAKCTQVVKAYLRVAEREHINVLEAWAVLHSINWRARRSGFCRSQFLHFVDSQVVAAAVTQGRTSSQRLKRVIRKINACALASHLYLIVGFCTSEDNPSDDPSRWSEGKVHNRVAGGVVQCFVHGNGDTMKTWWPKLFPGMNKTEDLTTARHSRCEARAGPAAWQL